MNINFRINFLKVLSGFTLVGIFINILSLLLVFIFLNLLNTPLIITYIGIYLGTLILSFILNSVLVFKSGLSLTNGVKYLIVYLSGMLFGALLLWYFKKTLEFENYILGYLVLPFTTAWNFSFSYLILKR